MAEIIDLTKAREARTPHMTGPAKCLDCGHEWTAVAPTGTTWMVCPACGLQRGRFAYPAEAPDAHWVCDCGNDLFHVSPSGILCPNCGQWVQGAV